MDKVSLLIQRERCHHIKNKELQACTPKDRSKNFFMFYFCNIKGSVLD